MQNLFLIGVLSLAVIQTKGASGDNVTIYNSFENEFYEESDLNTMFNGEWEIQEHKEGYAFNTRIENAQKVDVALPQKGKESFIPMVKIEGTVGTGNIPSDYFYFVAPERCYFKCCYEPTKSPIKISLLDEKQNHIFDVTDVFDEENYGANGSLKKGAYYLKIENSNSTSVPYSVYLALESFTYFQNEKDRTITLNDDFMSKYQALVWQSDYLPKDSEPIDGLILENNHKKDHLMVNDYPNILSCSKNYRDVYKIVYLWGKDSFEKLLKDAQNLHSSLKQIQKNNETISNITTSLSMITTGLSMVSFLFSNKILDTVNLSLGIWSNILGNQVSWNFTELLFYIGFIEGAISNLGNNDGTVLKLMQDSFIQKKSSGTKKRPHYQYRLKFQQRISDIDNPESENYIFLRKTDDHREVKLIANQNNPSKTSGSFRAYANIDDVESLIWEKY